MYVLAELSCCLYSKDETFILFDFDQPNEKKNVVWIKKQQHLLWLLPVFFGGGKIRVIFLKSILKKYRLLNRYYDCHVKKFFSWSDKIWISLLSSRWWIFHRGLVLLLNWKKKEKFFKFSIKIIIIELIIVNHICFFYTFKV